MIYYPWMIKFEFLNYAAFGFHSLLNIMRDFECDRDACWTWLIFDVLNVNVWNVHVECDVWPWIWSRCLLNLINFYVLNANVIVECDRYPWTWSNLNFWILHHLAFHRSSPVLKVTIVVQQAIRRQHAAAVLLVQKIKDKHPEHKMKVNELQREIKSLESQAADQTFSKRTAARQDIILCSDAA